MFWEDDVAGFFSGFGEPATLKDGTEITVIFNNEYYTAIPMDINIETSRPAAFVKTSDVGETVHGDTLTVRDTVYLIVGIQPDGTGITTLVLSK